MDADFWQQDRGTSFGLHAALATNQTHHSQAASSHLQQHHHYSQHYLTEQSSTPPPQHIPQSSGGNQQDYSTAITEQQHLHLHRQHHHHEHQHPHLTHLGAEQSNHLNVAAAATSSTHLSDVVKSNEDKINGINNNNNTNKNNNNSSNKHNIITKQGSTTNINTQQQQDQLQYSSQLIHKHQHQHSLKFKQCAASPERIPLEALHQQIQQKKHYIESSRISTMHNKITHKQENPQENQPHHLHQLPHQHQHQQLASESEDVTSQTNGESSSLDQQHQQLVLPVSATRTSPLASTSPLQLSTLVQSPTSSPQPSLTSPSGGSSTADFKISTENNNILPNDIQLHLSRSNSAAAISERTLEECWSTLQRLFMHKSAMQQIQQIPRTGLGPVGAGGVGAESKPHQCQQCMKSFSSNHQLVQHIRVHTGEKPYKCSYCDRRFKQLSHVQQHTRLHTGERPYKCHLPECGRAFIQLSNLQQHLRNHDAQVERAKNRPFHCNICGKGFATESSLRTHTSKELQLHLGVLQQHAALIGGPNATSCSICHKLFLGTDALMEHMKLVHKDKNSQSNNTPFIDGICGPAGNNLSNTGSTSCIQSSAASSSNDPYSAKRRTANHPCPVCGKHYVNEGSLRKHLACHAETSQLTNSLRMWPCSVCQAVFTHENGLLTHMEHMRMDPKHQFAAQYVLSRAAAERRERDNILVATLAVSAGSGGSGLMTLLGERGGSNSLCPSPSANSECSSNGRLSSSAASDPGSCINLLNNNNNNSVSNNNNSQNSNNNCNNSNSNLSLSNKLNDILRTSNNVNHPLGGSQHPHAHPHHGHSHNISAHGYSGIPSVDTDLQNRMSLMAAASAAAAAVAASANNSAVAGLSSPQRFGVEAAHTSAGNAAVQAAVVNLAAAMRFNQNSGSSSAVTATNNATSLAGNNASMQQPQQQQQQPQSQNSTQGTVSQNYTNGRTISPIHQVLTTNASTVVMNAMRDSMMRSTMMESTSQETNQHQPHQQQQHLTSGHSTYSHSNSTVMTQQQNAAQSHHHLQQQQQRHEPPQHQQQNSTASDVLQHINQHSHATNNPLQAPSSQSPETALHMQQQAEAILRSHTEAAFRLAASVVQQQTPETSINNSNGKLEQNHQITRVNEDSSVQQQKHNQNSQDMSEVIRLQEHRLEQALRLHNDARTFNFLSASTTQQPTTTTILNNPNTTNAEAAQQQQHHHAT